MASTAATAARRAQAIERLRTAADVAQARAALAIGEPAPVKDAEVDRIQWIEYAGSVLEALNATQPQPAADSVVGAPGAPTDDEGASAESASEQPAQPRRKR